ncbi:MAG: MFS transporter, partial [Anaerolineae bacterium]|nr:MFS transporter [Anaerolineae bacterium]
VAIDTVSSVIVYFMKDYLLRGSEANYVSGTLLVVQVVALPVFVVMSKRIGKMRAYIVGAAIWLVMMLISLLITPASPAFAIYVFAGLVGVGTGGIVVMMYAIFPDIPDVDELASGQRREGIYSAMVTFVRKLSSALAIFVVSQAIGAAGYVRPVAEVVNGVTRLVEQPQPDAFIQALRMIFAFVPPVLLVVGIFFASRFPLTPQRHARLNALLAARRSGQAETPEMRAEAIELQRELVG